MTLLTYWSFLSVPFRRRFFIRAVQLNKEHVIFANLALSSFQCQSGTIRSLDQLQNMKQRHKHMVRPQKNGNSDAFTWLLSFL